MFTKLAAVPTSVFSEQGIHVALVIVKFAFVSNAIRVGRNKAVHRCFLVCFQHATRPDGRAKWIPYFSDTVFQQQQLAFSLLVVVDRLRDRDIVNDVNIQRCMHDVDARVAAYRDLEVKGEAETTFLEGFSGGNLHRINKRRIRDGALTDAFG